MNVPLQMPDDMPQVFGRYLLVQRLNRGGMGEVFLAKHGLSGFEKICVIKKVLPHLNEDERFITRFVDEAQVAIRLQHANIAQVFEVGRVDDEYFLAIEFVEGRDLRRILGVLEERQQRFPVDLALFIAREVASGLAYAHRRKDLAGDSLELVHCDISPPNVMVSFEGEVKVIDFGISKSAMRATATDPQMGFGKFGYMAPEQLLRGGKVDHRTDIYATGSVLFELLTGHRLYQQGDNPDYRALAKKVIRGQHPQLSEIDPALAPYDALVSTALAPKPSKRYQQASELRDALQHALVQINPTLASEHVGEFMREMFSTELEEWRQMAARAQATSLSEWASQLQSTASTTVSFALASASEVGAEEALGGYPQATPQSYPRAAGSSVDGVTSLRSGEAILQSGVSYPSYPGPGSSYSSAPGFGEPSATSLVQKSERRGGFLVFFVATVVLGVLATTAFALFSPTSPFAIWPSSPAAAGGGDPGDGSRDGVDDDASATLAATLPLSGEPSDAAGDDATVDDGEGGESPPSGDSAAGEGQDSAGAGDAGTEETGDTEQADRKDTRASRRKKSRDRRARDRKRRDRKSRDAKSSDKKSEEISKAKIESRFRALSRDYQSFKSNFGGRLESDWSDLINAIQYAGNDPEKLRAVQSKMKQLKSKMAKLSADG